MAGTPKRKDQPTTKVKQYIKQSEAGRVIPARNVNHALAVVARKVISYRAATARECSHGRAGHHVG